MTRKGWIRLSEPGDKCSTHWKHSSGFEVKHCGHPTAIYPYYGTDLAGNMLLSPSGYGFRSLLAAMTAVEVKSSALYGFTFQEGSKTKCKLIS